VVIDADGDDFSLKGGKLATIRSSRGIMLTKCEKKDDDDVVTNIFYI
jgi:hypothetical protein